MNKKSTIITAVILYFVSTGASFGTFNYLYGTSDSFDNPAGTAGGSEATIDPEAPRTEECPLNGALYTVQERELWEERRPLAIMVENSVEARPHSGIIKADVVYEAVSEGGVTRFMPVFYCDAAFGDTTISPVRSVRTYFLDWASEYGETPLFGHVGGANCSAETLPDGNKGPCKTDKRAQAIEQLSDYGWRYSKGNDLDQFSVGAKAYIRNETRLGRRVATEHSVEGYTEKLWAEGADRGWTNLDPDGEEWMESFTPWEFKDGAEPSNRGTVSEIAHDFWDGYKQYDARWVYDSQTNTYQRYTGGEPHLDLETKQQITVSNVVVQKTTEITGVDDLKHNLYTTIGEGDALIFQDGKVIEGYWEKDARTERTVFTNKKGEEVEFTRGKIWISIVSDDTNVAY